MMKHQPITVLRYISLLQRNAQRYFDLALERDNIGGGQQFFLLCIFEQDGVSLLDLARFGGFDKGTVTRAVQKLGGEGYVYATPDEQDKRVHHLHLTDKGRALVERVYTVRDYWTASLTSGLGEAERERLLAALRAMSEHSCNTLKEIAGRKGELPHADPAG